MPIRYPEVLSLAAEPQIFEWTEDTSILYALGIGMCDGGDNEEELAFVLEPGVLALPTLATVIPWDPALDVEDRAGLTFSHTVHAEQKVALHRPMPAAGRAVARHRVVGISDKGAKGAFLVTETELLTHGGEPLATLTRSVAARFDGGFGGPSESLSVSHPMPDRAPDAIVELPTRRNQALLFRLSGDRNPLHANPQVARDAGFPLPILHGLCTFGLTCRAVLRAFADYDPARVLSHQARFSAPVFPGDTLTVELWRDGNEVSFVAKVATRNSIVITNGRSELKG
jgi:acyl dehydratase